MQQGEGTMDDATRLRLLEDALRDRDWMRVMDVVEDMGGKWDWRDFPSEQDARDGLTLPSEGAAPRDGGRKRCPICTRPMATAWDWKTLDGSEGIGLCWAGREPLA